MNPGEFNLRIIRTYCELYNVHVMYNRPLEFCIHINRRHHEYSINYKACFPWNTHTIVKYTHICGLICHSGAEFCVKLGFLPSYNGSVRSTLKRLTCQHWDSQTPHKHQYTDPDMFPEATLKDVANYCRTPDGSEWPWCFTTSPEVRSQVCYFDVTLCDSGLQSSKVCWKDAWLCISMA